MKYIIILFMLLSIQAIAQTDCNSLDSLTSFHGVRFGKPFPDSLKRYFVKEIKEDGTFSYSMPSWYTKTGRGFEKFSSWFNMGDSLSELYFNCNKNQNVIEVILKRTFSEPIANLNNSKKYPNFYRNITDELKATFGTPTLSDQEDKEEDFTFYSFIWNCKRMCIVANYGFNENRAICFILIYDINLTKTHQLDKYKY